METIDIKELLDYFKSKISIIVLFIAVIGIAGCLYGLFIQKPKYRSSTSIVLISEGQGNGSLTYNDVSLNQNLVSTYSEIVKSRRILNQVIKNLDLNYDYSYLSSNIEVSSVTGTQIIKISVIDGDNEKASDIANEIAKVLLVLGCGVVFIMYYFDRSVKNTTQIEEKLKLPVLGTIREYRG